MKKNISSIIIVAILILTTQSSFANNPLQINGQPLNYEYFSIGSKGILTMTIEDFDSKKAKKIPFKIYLRRDKKNVELGGFSSNNELSQIEISQILKFANLGDELVIEPVDKQYYTAKRVFFLKNNLVKFISNFILHSNDKDGC